MIVDRHWAPKSLEPKSQAVASLVVVVVGHRWRALQLANFAASSWSDDGKSAHFRLAECKSHLSSRLVCPNVCACVHLNFCLLSLRPQVGDRRPRFMHELTTSTRLAIGGRPGGERAGGPTPPGRPRFDRRLPDDRAAGGLAGQCARAHRKWTSRRLAVTDFNKPATSLPLD